MCELKKSSSNALSPIFGFMLYLEHLKFVEYFLGVENENFRVEMQIAENQILMSHVYTNKCVN